MALMLLCSSGFAAPLMDYSAEKVAIDVSVQPNADLTVKLPATYSTDSKGTPFRFGITTGLGDNFALQYRQFNLNTKQSPTGDFGFLRPAQQTFKELNLYYKVAKNTSLFVGIVHHDYHTLDNNLQPMYISPTTKAFQGGLVTVADLGKDVSAYGIFAVGTKQLRSCELGLSYAITSQLDFDMYYKTQQIEFDYGYDSHVNGIGYGLTYKF